MSDLPTIEYNHTTGAIELRFPSGSRLPFTKHTIGELLPTLNALHCISARDAGKLTKPLSADEVKEMVRIYTEVEKHVIIKPLARPKPGAEIDLKELGLL